MSDAQCQNDEVCPPPSKIIKLSNECNNGVNKDHHQFKDFVLEKVLNNNTNRKIVSVLGKFKNKNGDALIILEKKAFKNEQLTEKGYFSVDGVLRTFFQNDIYGNCEYFPNAEINSVKVTIIYPATDKHIAKFSQQPIHLVLETNDLYNNLTLPHIQKEQFNLQWVYNIIDGNNEQERVVYDNKCEKEGFILLPDLKWDGITKETLYLLAIVRQRGIKSLRDLNASHLPLLRRVRDEGQQAILKKYNLPRNLLRVYLHYQPSFYHLHIHFTYLRHEAPGIYTEKSHLLDTVINNIEMLGDYYQKATLPFTIREMDNLFSVYEKHGLVKRVDS